MYRTSADRSNKVPTRRVKPTFSWSEKYRQTEQTAKIAPSPITDHRRFKFQMLWLITVLLRLYSTSGSGPSSRVLIAEEHAGSDPSPESDGCSFGSLPGTWVNGSWRLLHDDDCQLHALLHESFANPDEAAAAAAEFKLSAYSQHTPRSILFIGGGEGLALLHAMREGSTAGIIRGALALTPRRLGVTGLMLSPCGEWERGRTEWAHLRMPLGGAGGRFDAGFLTSAWRSYSAKLAGLKV